MIKKLLAYDSDNELLNALRRGDEAAFEYLYRRYYRMAARQVRDQGFAGIEAEDLFQEVLLILVQKIQNPDFRLTAKLSTYLFAIMRNLAFKKTGKKPAAPLPDDAALSKEEPISVAERSLWEEKLNVVSGYLELLEDNCQRLLLLSFFEKRPQAEIAAAMGYSESFVKVKKHRCLEYLRKKIKSHPLFKDE